MTESVNDASTGRQVVRRSLELPVSLAADGPADHVIRGELCAPAGGARVVHVLVSGATYGRAYWDFPVEPSRYSYVAAMVARGIATLNLDRIGIGASSRPDPSSVTVPAGAHVIHQVIAALRAGRYGASFDRIVAVGHSLGSVIVISEAATFGDVDAVVVSGLLHHLDDGLSELTDNLQPVASEPERFGDVAAGYLTTPPGWRARIFYAPGTVDEAVAEMDEATKQTMTEAEAESFPAELARSATIELPVLVIVGDRDSFFCTYIPCSASGGAAFDERMHWAAADTAGLLTVDVVPDLGHALCLSRKAPEFFRRVADWTDRVLPT